MNVSISDADKMTFEENAFRAMTVLDETANIIFIKRDGSFKFMYLTAWYMMPNFPPIMVMFLANDEKDLKTEIESFRNAEVSEPEKHEKYFPGAKSVVQKLCDKAEVQEIAKIECPENMTLEGSADVFKKWIMSERAKRGIK